MKVLTLLAQKGGAGKSTLALHWAVEAGRSGKRHVVNTPWHNGPLPI